VIRTRHAVEPAVSLGQLLPCPSLPGLPEWVDRQDREIEPPKEQPSGVRGIRDEADGSVILKVLPPSIEPEPRKILIGDTALTPYTKLDVVDVPVSIVRSEEREFWKIRREENDLLQTELQSIANLRRIWTRELLTLRRCELDREFILGGWRQPIDEPHQPEQNEFHPSADFQPGTSEVPHIPAEVLPAESAAHLAKERQLEPAQQAPHLIGPKLKVQFDLQPLPRA